MNDEQFVLIDSLITVAAHQAGLGPGNRGGFDGGYGTVWSWRWMDAADPIIAGVEVYMLPDEFGVGVEIKVSSASYDYEDRSKSYSRPYWGRYIEYKDLLQEEKMSGIVNEIRESLSRAWQELPQQVALLPQKAEEMRAFKVGLKNRGLLQE